MNRTQRIKAALSPFAAFYPFVAILILYGTQEDWVVGTARFAREEAEKNAPNEFGKDNE